MRLDHVKDLCAVDLFFNVLKDFIRPQFIFMLKELVNRFWKSFCESDYFLRPIKTIRKQHRIKTDQNAIERMKKLKILVTAVVPLLKAKSKTQQILFWILDLRLFSGYFFRLKWARIYSWMIYSRDALILVLSALKQTGLAFWGQFSSLKPYSWLKREQRA